MKPAGIVAAIIIIVLFLAFLATPERETSPLENRTLASFPDISLGAFMDGSFQKNIDKYFSDQFPLRDSFVKLDIALDRLGQSAAGEEYEYRVEGADGYDYYVYDDELILALLREKKDTDTADLWIQKLSDAAELCGESGVDMAVAIFPSKAEALIGMEPEFHQNNSDRAVLERVFDALPDNVLKLDGVEEFGKLPLDELRERYFKRDNHWNFYGAQCGYEWMLLRLAERFGLTVQNRSFEPVPNIQQAMSGAYGRFVGFDDAREEKIEYYVPEGTVFEPKYYIDGDEISDEPEEGGEISDEVRLPTNASSYSGYKVWLNGESVELDDIFCSKVMGENIGYSTLTMDNEAWVKIRNEDADNDYVLLVVHDSFYNAIALNMSLAISEQHIIDTRTFKDFCLEDFIKENGIDGVLFFYNSNAFFKIEDHLNFEVGSRDTAA